MKAFPLASVEDGRKFEQAFALITMHSNGEVEGGSHENNPEVEDEVIEHSRDTAVAFAVPYPHHLLVRPSCWSSGICGCAEVCSICCVTWFCPCITFGRVAEVADQGRWRCYAYGTIYCLLSLVGIEWLYSFMFRKKLRAMYSLAEHPCNDCCMHCWCGRCALCQEAREIKYRADWVEPAMAPPVAQGMTSNDMPPPYYEKENVKLRRCGLFRFFLEHF